MVALDGTVARIGFSLVWRRRNQLLAGYDKGYDCLPKHFDCMLKIRLNLKLHCFHKTKQTQNEVGKFFYNLGKFVSSTFATV